MNLEIMIKEYLMAEISVGEISEICGLTRL